MKCYYFTNPLHRVQTANYMVSVSTVISSTNKWPPFNNKINQYLSG